MSDLSQNILFEHPLNEKVRTWLRLEFLLQQLQHNRSLTNLTNTLSFFRTVSELLDIIDRGDVRTELVKELERQQHKLLQWIDVPGVDSERLSSLRHTLKEHSNTLLAAPRLGQELKDDRLISMVRQRLSIPGGCCSFDLPVLHMWLHNPKLQRDEQVAEWIETITPLSNALNACLELIRQSGAFQKQTSLNGFYQDTAEDSDILRIRVDSAYQLYPQVSGHKSRFAIRFMPFDSDIGETPERFNFEIACC
ncbi:cell division protein ZapD [Jinshanibacter sp. LJY008]|uniref:Cell division protein ZapD n=1 Tax=Limnobaculum eriocheiris TaxID=2897391 RepID=A0A9X1MUS2_9GAMM|nr:cell division protein ZapD [Limnobaculum eriocheiris]MCD1125966.1 cell division protein ZapD [Limnobaculum eriocheiris]